MYNPKPAEVIERADKNCKQEALRLAIRPCDFVMKISLLMSIAVYVKD